MEWNFRQEIPRVFEIHRQHSRRKAAVRANDFLFLFSFLPLGRFLFAEIPPVQNCLQDIPLIGEDLRFSDYIPSLDTKEAFEKRIRFINWIINNKNYKYITGTLVDICNFIDQNL